MGSVIALLLILVTLYFVVLFGTVAYQLTGLDWHTAQFQALSAFTMTGFTTRASELVVQHPIRRRITMTLVVSGYAATATVVATLVTSVSNKTLLVTLENIALMGMVVVLFSIAARQSGLQERLAEPVRAFLHTRIHPDLVPQEELLEYQQGYGIVRIEIPAHCRLEGLALHETDIKDFRLQVLAIERRDQVLAVPAGSVVIQQGDHVVLYGKMNNVDAAFRSTRQSAPAPREEAAS